MPAARTALNREPGSSIDAEVDCKTDAGTDRRLFLFLNWYCPDFVTEEAPCVTAGSN